MVKAILEDAEFIRMFREAGPSAIARHTGQHLRSVFERRRNLEIKHRTQLNPPTASSNPRPPIPQHPERLHLTVHDGIVLVGSDGHYWPGHATVAHRAFVNFCRQLRPSAIIFNGDSLDASTISRHPPLSWNRLPTVQEEIECCQERLGEIELAKPMNCRLIHPLGNHDARYEVRIATVAPEYANVYGTSLQDHFPAWEPCWSVWINDDVVIKHRWKGGTHAVHNNTVNSGLTMITGHDHALRVSPYTDYTGTRWGVSTGTLADPYGPQFLYMEDNCRNWRAGFCVLTFVDGVLLQPELVMVWDATHVQWRGSIIEVPMSDDDELEDYMIGGGSAAPKEKRRKAPMKPPEARKKRPVIVKSLSKSKREHYARAKSKTSKQVLDEAVKKYERAMRRLADK